MPAANVQHLMLRRDVVEAVAAARFHVWPVATVDQAVELLTGMPPAERDATNRFPEDSFNGVIEARLLAYAESRREYVAAPAEAGNEVL
jgi:predicted ATP-dependent protease